MISLDDLSRSEGKKCEILFGNKLPEYISDDELSLIGKIISVVSAGDDEDESGECGKGGFNFVTDDFPYFIRIGEFESIKEV